MGWESVMDDAKKGHRPCLKNWSRDGFSSVRALEFDQLASKICREDARCRIAIESASSLTADAFVEKYEKKYIPVLITGIVEQEEWAAERRWTLSRLKEDFRDRKFKCGEDDDGYAIKVSMRNFTKYMESQSDDSPLYIFDSHFDDDYSAKRILDDYTVPKYFPSNPDQQNRVNQTRGNDETGDNQATTNSASSKKNLGSSVDYHDIFSLVGEKRRPPHRWFLMGPRRSGTCVHIDPLASSAWNTVVSGRKLWVLFPPGTPKSVVKAKKQLLANEDDEAINYFIDLIPRLKRDHPTLDVYQFIQGPGDTVFIPGGWWHAVLNLEDTIAITENFCSKQNFDKVWKETRTGRKKMAQKWLQCLKLQYPDLALRAEQLNAEDGFVMPFDKKIDPGTGEESGRKSKKDKKSKKSKSKSRSQSRDSAELKPNDDGRKKHESALDAFHNRQAEDAAMSDDCDSVDSKGHKRKIDKVAGASAGIGCMSVEE